MRKLNALAAILTIVGGLNWGLVGLFKFDLVAAVFGGMQFGEVNVASRIVYTLVGLSALYLATSCGRSSAPRSQPRDPSPPEQFSKGSRNACPHPRRAAVAGVLGLALLAPPAAATMPAPREPDACLRPRPPHR